VSADLIAGRYQLLETTSQPGVPQRARDLKTAQTVLLRERDLPEDEDGALKRAHDARGIFHPSLVTLFDVFPQPDHRLLLAYEFVSAQTVAQMTGGQSLNPRRAAALVSEVADAVAELHAHEVTHGGISQATVLVTLKGKAKLDRVGDPWVRAAVAPSYAGDIAALGELLHDLTRARERGVVGVLGLQALVSRARDGKFDSAATFAALLRRAAESI